MTTPNVNVEPAEQRLPLARRRSLVLALAGGAALASLPARAQSTAGGKADILIGRSTALSGGMAPCLASGGGAWCRCGQQAAGALVCFGTAERTQLRPACLAR